MGKELDEDAPGREEVRPRPVVEQKNLIH